MLNRRLSKPRAVSVVALAAVLAAAVSVTPSLAGSFLTNQKASQLFLTNKKASKTYLSNKKAAGLFLKKKSAGNLYVAKKTAPLPPVGPWPRERRPFGPSAATTAGYIPTAFTSFAVKGTGPAVITFSGNVICTAAKPGPDSPARSKSWSTARKPAKSTSPPRRPKQPTPSRWPTRSRTTTVLTKGGHTIAIQYLGSTKAVFTLKGWNLAVQAFPQLPERTDDRGAQHEIRRSERPAGTPRPSSAAGAGEGLAEDQAGAVVEGLVGADLPGAPGVGTSWRGSGRCRRATRRGSGHGGGRGR